MALQGEAKRLYHREYRIVVSLASGYRLCQSCYETVGALFAAERAVRGR